MEDAERDALHDQRHAEHRLDPLLTQDRVVDPVLVDVDHERPRLRGDAPGEAGPERDPDALLDLLLDPERRTRDESVRFLVQQEDRARVYLEDLPRSFEQGRQQLVETQVRESRIRDRL